MVPTVDLLLIPLFRFVSEYINIDVGYSYDYVYIFSHDVFIRSKLPIIVQVSGEF